MKYFDKKFLDFFIELAPNNNKDWFDSNRKRYQDDVKEPFISFVEAVLENMPDKKIYKGLRPSDCIFRINRDVRFSKEKIPYKTQVSALISPGGKKDMQAPGLYFELGPEHLAIYTGFYMPDKFQIQTIREKIFNHQKEFKKIISKKSFIESFGEIKGEKQVRIPKEFREAAIELPVLLNKQFYLQNLSEPEIILSENLLKYILKTYSNAAEFQQFFY